MHLQPSILTKRAFKRLLEIAPSKNIDGFIYATAWNSGVIDETSKDSAILVLRNITQDWPQRPPLNLSYYNNQANVEDWSMMGFHAKLLTNPPFTKFNK